MALAVFNNSLQELKDVRAVYRIAAYPVLWDVILCYQVDMRPEWWMHVNSQVGGRRAPASDYWEALRVACRICPAVVE
jgi:hypothetical protein